MNVDRLIEAHVRDQSRESFLALNKAIIEAEFALPVSGHISKINSNHYDVPVLCIKTDRGGAIPAFTTEAHLLAWKPEGSNYAMLRGRALLEMAKEMREISEIVINIQAGPSGRIPRADFDGILSLS